MAKAARDTHIQVSMGLSEHTVGSGYTRIWAADGRSTGNDLAETETAAAEPSAETL